jgi:hypothetical protein
MITIGSSPIVLSGAATAVLANPALSIRHRVGKPGSLKLETIENAANRFLKQQATGKTGWAIALKTI